LLEASIEINTTHSGDPGLEQRIIILVASYGHQGGWLVEAVDVLARQQSRRGFGETDSCALDQLAERVAAVREQAAFDQVDRIVAEVAPIS
jgi:hypothetical protein